MEGIEFTHDVRADAVYITLATELPYAYGVDLDHRRRIDFAEGGEPVGIELPSVSKGVLLNDLPRRDKVAQLLAVHGIRTLVAR